jgi:hypothetical protein
MRGILRTTVGVVNEVRFGLTLPNPHAQCVNNQMTAHVIALYVTDGNYDADLATLIMQTLGLQRAVPKVIIVGIGYDTNEDAAPTRIAPESFAAANGR